MRRFCVLISLCLVCVPVIVHGQDITTNVNRIMAAAQEDTQGLDRLTEMCDTFGPRLSGTQALEDAIDWVVGEMQADGLANVSKEKVMVPQWFPGEASLRMKTPREKVMSVLPLGGSVGTPNGETLTGEAVVVHSFEELREQCANVSGKIVVYNQEFVSYGVSVAYRREGATEAAKCGALAAVVRSVTDFSLYTPHTGISDTASIPAASITVEDAELMDRLQQYGHTLTLELFMNCESTGEALSHNVIAEVVGSTKPDEFVVIGGHIDSWHVGSGAMDDAGGCYLGWQTLVLLNSLGIRPARTIRAVMWTSEEQGGSGSRQYFDDYISQVNSTVFAMESDGGIFHPDHYTFSGTSVSKTIFNDRVQRYLSPNNITMDVVSGGAGADVTPLTNAGVPGAGLAVSEFGTKNPVYFWYHHTDADTADKIHLRDFRNCLAAFAGTAYMMAELPALPRS